MLNKFRYKNKMRYIIRKKKDTLLLSEKQKNNNFKTQYKINKYGNKNWQGTMFWKYQNVNNILYRLACNQHKELTDNFWKEKRGDKDWFYHPASVYRKRPFLTKTEDRKTFIDNILLCIKQKDSLYYLRNSLYYLLDENFNINKVFDILNFSWLYTYKKTHNEYCVNVEQFNSLSLKFFYKGFLKNGNKRKCEIRFIQLLSLLKAKLKKSSLHIMYFFIFLLRPFMGFRRQRLGRRKQKKKDVRYLFKLYSHNTRWQSLLIKRVCFNSPYYQKNTRNVSVFDLYNGLLNSINSKGPIAKCLGMYYTLIGRRTPYAQRKKKKKKGKSIRI